MHVCGGGGGGGGMGDKLTKKRKTGLQSPHKIL